MVSIYWSYTEQKLISSIYSKGTASTYEWALRDVVPVSLYIVEPQNVTTQPYIITDIPAGFTFKMEAKQEGEFDGNPLLCGTDWVKTGTGITTVYTTNIRLDNPNMVGALEGDSSSSMNMDYLEIIGELTRVTTEGENCDSTQFDIKIISDVIRLTDVCPVPVEYSSSSSSDFIWAERTPAGDVDTNWWGVASDSDGSHLIAGVNPGRLWTSDDSGATWTERRPAGDVGKLWGGVASDSDGSNLIAGDYGGRLWTSTDSGVTWTEQRPAGAQDKYWESVASDSDGSHLIAGDYGGRLWTGENN